MDFERVEARGLVKMYGPTRALSGVDLDLESGRVTVVEGPNGSGKSTLMALLSLLSRPTRGTLRFGPHDAESHPEALRRHIGVLSHASMLYPDLTGIEGLRFTARLHGVPAADATLAQLRARFDIGAFGDRPTRTYSRGQLQRVAIARALVHRPRLLLLDEPSTGLDAASVDRLVAAVREEKARGAIVALVTHDAALSSCLADATVTLARGRVVTPSGTEVRA